MAGVNWMRSGASGRALWFWRQFRLPLASRRARMASEKMTRPVSLWPP